MLSMQFVHYRGKRPEENKHTLKAILECFIFISSFPDCL